MSVILDIKAKIENAHILGKNLLLDILDVQVIFSCSHQY